MGLFAIAVLLGVIEGITEFLPISSTGHLIIAGHYLSFHNEELQTTFTISIQLGSILAVVVYFREKILAVFSGLNKEGVERTLFITVLVAFIPSAVMGLLFHHMIEELLFNPISVACALIVGGILIILIENKVYHPEITTVDNVGIKKGFYIGCFQCLALFPGMSRSASTIMGSLVLGLDRKSAAEFSFFLAIPTMFAATGYSIVKERDALSMDDFSLIFVGLVTAFIVSLFVIRLLFDFIKRYDFKAFAYYRIAIGIIILLFFQA